MLNNRTILAAVVPMVATIAAAPPALARDGAFIAPPQPSTMSVNPGGTDLAATTTETTVSQPSAATGLCPRITIALPFPWALFADRVRTRLLPLQPDGAAEDGCVIVTLAPAPPSHAAPMPKSTMMPPVENQGPGSGAYTPNPGPITSTTTTAPTTTAPVENQGPGSGAYTPNPGPITSTTTTAPTTTAPVENQGPGSGAYTPNPGPITSTTTTAPTTTSTLPQNTTTLPDGQVVVTGTHW